ncbi:MAG: carboxypeptidase-like regulatory domain-containing protein [Bryobacteraceae bacterium]
MTNSWQALFAVPIVAALMFGQAVTSTVTGKLTDLSSAGIPLARVKVVNEESGITFNSQSNEVGLYRVPSLSPGRVEVEAQGFQRLVRKGLVVQVSDTVQADLTLQVGSVSETLNVTSAAPVVEAQTSSVGQLVERGMKGCRCRTVRRRL